jgi:ABC-2 type transport system permease protein
VVSAGPQAERPQGWAVPGRSRARHAAPRPHRATSFPLFVGDTMLIFRRQMRQSLRNPFWVVLGLSQPLLYLALFGPLLTKISELGLPGMQPGRPYNFFVPGLLIQVGLFGSAFVGFSVIAEWRTGVLERFRVTPVSRLALLVGRVLRDVVMLELQAAILVLAGVVFGLRVPFLGLLIGLGFIAIVAVSLAATSYALALLLKNEGALASLINIVVVPLMLLSGVMLPMTLGPHWLQTVARFTPFVYIINAMREVFDGVYFSGTVLEGVYVAVGLAVFCLSLAVRAFVRENA